MPSQQRNRTVDRNAARERRAARSAQQDSKAVRAHLRTMEIRDAETRTIAAAAPTVAEDQVSGVGNVASDAARRAVSSTRKVVSRPVMLSKKQEYRFIRHDLRRLGTTAGALFVVMIVLLFVVD